MTTTIQALGTDPDTALAELRGSVESLVAADPAEWTLDQLERAIVDLHTLTTNKQVGTLIFMHKT